MTTLFAITLFWSAALLFWVEPMVGKLVLPQLGGKVILDADAKQFLPLMNLRQLDAGEGKRP